MKDSIVFFLLLIFYSSLAQKKTDDNTSNYNSDIELSKTLSTKTILIIVGLSLIVGIGIFVISCIYCRTRKYRQNYRYTTYNI